MGAPCGQIMGHVKTVLVLLDGWANLGGSTPLMQSLADFNLLIHAGPMWGSCKKKLHGGRRKDFQDLNPGYHSWLTACSTSPLMKVTMFGTAFGLGKEVCVGAMCGPCDQVVASEKVPALLLTFTFLSAAIMPMLFLTVAHALSCGPHVTSYEQAGDNLGAAGGLGLFDEILNPKQSLGMALQGHVAPMGSGTAAPENDIGAAG
jgi:hypothetical protein